MPSAPKRVWEVVCDPSAVVSCVGGAELGEFHDDGSFDAVLVVRFGGIRVRFAARVTLELDEDQREGRLTARGRDGQGATRFSGTAVFAVTEDPAAGGARVAMDGEVNLSGKLAPLIESGAGVVVKKMTREFSETFTQLCAAPAHLGAAPGDSAVAAQARPSLWQRIRERLTRLFGHGRRRPSSAQPEGSASAAPSASSRGNRL